MHELPAASSRAHQRVSLRWRGFELVTQELFGRATRKFEATRWHNGGGPVPVYADLLIYFAIVGAAGVAYLVRKHRREASKPHRGVADAYEGNLVILPPGHGQRAKPGFRSSSGNHHTAHGHGHAGHFGGHHAGGLHH
jgi:hypothetical protein